MRCRRRRGWPDAPRASRRPGRPTQVDDPLDRGVCSRRREVAGTLEVGMRKVALSDGVDEEIGDVDTGRGDERFAHRLRLGHVERDPLDVVGPIEVPQLVRVPSSRDHLVARGDESSDQPRSDVAGCPCHQSPRHFARLAAPTTSTASDRRGLRRARSRRKGGDAVRCGAIGYSGSRRRRRARPPSRMNPTPRHRGPVSIMIGRQLDIR